MTNILHLTLATLFAIMIYTYGGEDMVRIRYVKVDNNTLKSIQIVTSATTGAKYQVRLKLDTMTYEIKNMTRETLIKGGENINSLRVLKDAAKKRLKSLGVQFDVEVRDI